MEWGWGGILEVGKEGRREGIGEELGTGFDLLSVLWLSPTFHRNRGSMMPADKDGNQGKTLWVRAARKQLKAITLIF